MRLIAPHFQRAILIGKVIDLHRVEAAAMVATIAGLAAGVFLVNALGSLVHANASGEAMLAAEDPLKLTKGALISIDERAQPALRKAFDDALAGDATAGAGGASVPLVGKSGDHFVAHVLPLTGGGAAGRREHRGDGGSLRPAGHASTSRRRSPRPRSSMASRPPRSGCSGP